MTTRWQLLLSLAPYQAGDLLGFRREELQLGVHNLGEESALRLGKEWEFALIMLSAGKISAQPSVDPPSVLSAACLAIKKKPLTLRDPSQALRDLKLHCQHRKRHWRS